VFGLRHVSGSSGRGDGTTLGRRDCCADGSSLDHTGGPELKVADRIGGISIAASAPSGLVDADVRLLLVDDDPVSRAETLGAVQAADIQAVGVTDNGRHALDLARLLQPDLALIAWNMPGFGGALTASLMRRYAPAVTPVLLLEPEDIAEVREAPPGMPLRSVMKRGDAEELRAMLRAIHRHASARSRRGTADGRGVADIRER
jgi:CheY-like chemotaxis protein